MTDPNNGFRGTPTAPQYKNPYSDNNAQFMQDGPGSVPIFGPLMQGTYESILDPGAGAQREAQQNAAVGHFMQQTGAAEQGQVNDARDLSMGFYGPAQSQYDMAYGQGGTLNGPGYGEQAFNQMGGSMLGNTQSQDAYGYGAGVLSNNNPLGDVYQNAQGDFSSPSMQQQMLSRQGQGFTNNPYLSGTQGYQQGAAGSSDYMNYMYGANSGQLTSPGAMEQFAERSKNAATDPYYQQLQKQQSGQIDASMNARGAYNSGAALAAQALGNSNLAAQQYHDQANIQQMGQSAQNQRLQTGLGYGQGASSSNLAGNMGAGNMGISAGNTYASGLNDYFSVGQGIDQNQLARYNTLGNLAQGTGQQSYQNAMGIGNLAHTASGDALAGQQAYYGAANNAQTQMQGRTQQGISDAMGMGTAMGNTYMEGTQNGIQDYNQLLGNYTNMMGQAASAAKAADDKNQGGAIGLVKTIIGGVGG